MFDEHSQEIQEVQTQTGSVVATAQAITIANDQAVGAGVREIPGVSIFQEGQQVIR